MTRIAANSRNADESAARALLAFAFVAACIATYSTSPLVADGSGLLFELLDKQRFALPHDRFALVTFQLLPLLLSKVTDDVRLISFVYSAGYAFVPFFALLASHRIDRNRAGHAFLWPALWVFAGALPGQMFYVSECIISLHLGWVLLLFVTTELSPRRWVLVIALTVFLGILHPIAGPLFLFLGLVAFVRARLRRDATSRGLFTAGSILLLAGIVRSFASSHADYESLAASSTIEFVTHRTLWARCVPVGLIAVPFGLVVLALLVGSSRRESRTPNEAMRLLSGLLVMAVVFFGVTMLRWAADRTRWADPINYRYLAPFIAAPLYLACAIEAIARDKALAPTRASLPTNAFASKCVRRFMVAVALLSTSALSIQSILWFEMRGELRRALDGMAACTSPHTVPLLKNSALHSYAISAYAILVQGRTPRKLVLGAEACNAPTFKTEIRVFSWYTRPRTSDRWFDLRRAGLPLEPGE